MSFLNSISNKIFGEKADSGTDNAERARIVEILEKGSNDEILKLRNKLERDILENFTNMGLRLFAKVFYWKPINLRVRYGMINTSVFCSVFLDEIKHLSETIDKERNRLYEIYEKLGSGSDTEFTKELVFFNKRVTYLLNFQLLFNSKDNYSKAFWDIVEMEYGEEDTKDLKEQYSDTIDSLVNLCEIFDENGCLKENLTFIFLGSMMAYYELLFRFDEEIANKFIQTITEKNIVKE